MDPAGKLVYSGIICFIKALAVKPAGQYQGLIFFWIDILKQNVRSERQAAAADDNFLEPGCGDRCFADVLPIPGPGKDIQNGDGLEVFKALC